MYDRIWLPTALIDVSEDDQLSEEVDLEAFEVIGLIIPTLDNCNVTFKVCEESEGTFRDLKDKSGNAITIAATTGGFAVASDDLAPLLGYQFVKIATSQVQTEDRTLVFILKS